MSQLVELPDAVYDQLQKLAEQEGTTPARWIAANLPALPRSRQDQAGEDPASARVEAPSDSIPNAWDVLDAMAGTVDAPEDWSTEHDHYITGSPKRQKEV